MPGNLQVKALTLRTGIIYIMPTLLTLVSACSPHAPIKKYKIGFSQCTFGDVWRQTMKKEIERELSFHPDIELVVTDANLSAEKQKEQIRQLVDQDIALLIASPAEAEPIAPVIDSVYENDIPVILVDRNTLSKKYTAFIGANNYKIGYDAGAYAYSLLKGKGRVMEIAGPDIGSSADIGRHKGFSDYISKYPDIKYVSRFNEDWDRFPREWENHFTELLRSTPDIQLIFSQNDRLAFAAYNVCKKLGLDKKISIIGIDGLPGENGGIDLVERGILKATIVYPTGGKEAIRTAISIIKGKAYAKNQELPSPIIDSTNVTMVRLQNDKLLEQQHDIDERTKLIERQIAITENQAKIIITVSITLALALVFGGILLYYLHENKKINARLALQKEEISEQRNKLIDVMSKLQRATEAKFNFFTNISHELRTPLTLIIAPLEESLTSSKLHFTIKNNLTYIYRNSIRLLRLINQLMDYRKIEEGKMRLQTSENNISTFVKDTIDTFQLSARKKSISFQLIDNVPNLKVYFDVDMFDKILFNLLSNSIKFTPDGGLITIRMQKSNDNKNVEIDIEDTGVGIKPEELEHLFESFYQGHHNSFKGSGLGLALTKELVLLHQGTITVSSQQNQGTKFKLCFPLGAAHLKPDQVLSNNRPNSDDSILYSNENELEVMPPDPDNNGNFNHSILIVEDNDDLRTFLKNRLSNSYEVIEADNGERGLELAFEYIPDLVISDIILPGKDGIQITEILKHDIRTSHIPIILLTAKASMREQIEGIKSQADAFIVKPFNLEYLDENVKTLLKNRGVLKEHYTSLILDSKNSNLNRLDRKFINHFTSIVQNNLSNENFTVEEICKEIGISRVQLYRKVKALLGYNINDYILTVRLKKAKFLFTYENLSISEVAFKVGFSSATYFSTVFKSRYQITPSEFKDSIKIGKT